MTREEIISGLKFTIEMFLLDPITGETFKEPRNDMDKTTIDACRGAIELLEQEPRKGRWIRVDKDKLRCSKCDVIHFIAQYPQGKIAWCPNCGSRNEVEE